MFMFPRLPTLATVAIVMMTSVSGLDNGLGLTPAMGWNSWNLYQCNISESIVKSIADSLASTGLRDLGYHYVTIDDCWQLDRDNRTGRIQEDPTRFPSGMKALGDYIHSKGLKFGIYSSAGVKTCEGRPGGLGYEDIDAKTYAEWGVDFLKYDNCYNKGLSSKEGNIARYSAMRDALNKTGRPIHYNICNWGQASVWNWARDIGNSWRTTGDIGDLFDAYHPRCPCVDKDCWLVKQNKGLSHCSITNIIDKQVDITKFSGPGGFNDMDMLEVGNGGMTAAEYRTHFSVWAALKSPLILGNNVANMTKEDFEIISNPEVIAINQDPLGISASLVNRRLKREASLHVAYDVWTGPLVDNSFVFVILNRDKVHRNITLDFQKYLQGKVTSGMSLTIRDLWKRKDQGAAKAGDSFTVHVDAHDAVVLKVSRP